MAMSGVRGPGIIAFRRFDYSNLPLNAESSGDYPLDTPG